MLGKTAWIYGTVKSVRRIPDGHIFINLEQPCPNQMFTIMVRKDYVKNFDRVFGYGWENDLIESMVCVYGVVEEYYKEIEITDPAQLKRVDIYTITTCPCYETK